jgi:iron complex outermembrane receptor protein
MSPTTLVMKIPHASPFRSSIDRLAARCHFLSRMGPALIALAVVLSSSVSTPLQAQAGGTGVVEGRVLNPATGDYLLNARVSVKGSDRVSLTDSTGTYRLDNLPAGSVTLRVILAGLDEEERVVDVKAGETQQQDFNLTSKSRSGTSAEVVKLSEFTVAASREMNATALALNEHRYAGNIKDVIAADAFGDVSEGNLGEFIKLMPGVAILYAAGDASQISLRGFAGTQTPITIDGNSIPSAPSSATGASRGILLEQISMTNVSRVEVIKTPIPSMSADFLGGAVNLIGKSSFERSKPQLTVRGTVQFTSDDYTWSKTPGPGTPKTRKLRPGYDVSLIYPVSKNFGFTLSSLMSDQFGRLLSPVSTWVFAPAQGGSETAPYRQSVNPRNDPRETKRESYAASVDWRPIESLTLGFGFRRGSYDLFTAPDRMTLSVGTNPASYGPDFTQGRSGQATGTHQQIWTGKEGATDQYTFTSKYRKGPWTADFSASLGKSDLDYPNIQRGFFRSAVTRLTNPSTLRLEGFHLTDAPRVIELRNAATGAVTDWKNLSHYTIVNVGADNRNATDDIEQGKLSLRREFWLGRNPLAVQIGGSYNKRTLDRIQWTPNWTFLGADGRAGTADDSAGPFADPVNVGQNAKFNTPRDIQWVDLRALWALYVAHPNYFQLVEPAAYITSATSSERIEETIKAGYVQGEIKFLENRLAFVGGVRFERTEDVGAGLLRDRNAIYQRDARGNLIRNPNGTPILITTDPLAQAKLSYIPRGLSVDKSYDDYYPSGNLTYKVSENLQFRLSYSQTLGRPEFSNIIPNVDINEDTSTVTARNPALKPWTAKNYEVSVEYYFKSDGVVSVGLFRKDVTNAFITSRSILDSALLAQYGLDSIYDGFELVGRSNASDVTRINGIEVSYQQQLTFLPLWARGFSVFANGTFLKTSGSTRIGLSLQDKTLNWGVSYSRKRFGAGLKWNYIGGDETALTSIGPGGLTVTKPLMTLDVNSEFRFTPRFSLFFNARNFTNESTRTYRLSPLTPSYSHAGTFSNGGVKMSAGIKATY